MNDRTISETIPVDDQGRHLTLDVSHNKDRKCFNVTLWREHRDRGIVTVSIMEDANRWASIPVARFSAKKLQETFDTYKHLLADDRLITWARQKKI